MSHKTLTIEYFFTLADGTQEAFSFVLDAKSLTLVNHAPESLPLWTKLDFHKCKHCPLNSETHLYCPLAVNLVDIIKRFEKLQSYDQVQIKVTTEERMILQKTTIQTGISSLMSLVMAVSGCPHTGFFKPLARFHLPISSEFDQIHVDMVEETVYRSASMYLLAQYFLAKDGRKTDFELKNLHTIYLNIHRVNLGMAERLREVSATDAAINAIVMLDMYAQAVPRVIEGSLDKIRYLFDSFFEEPDPG